MLCVEINDYLYDHDKNIIRYDNPPEFLIGEIDYTEKVHISFPIYLNRSIIEDCCKFKEISRFVFEKDGLIVCLKSDGHFYIEENIIFWLNGLQQIYRNKIDKELLIDITNIQKYL